MVDGALQAENGTILDSSINVAVLWVVVISSWGVIMNEGGASSIVVES